MVDVRSPAEIRFEGEPAALASRPRSVLLVASIDALGIARLPRLFRNAGYRVTVLANIGHAVLQSRFVNERIVADRGMDDLVEKLAQILNVEPKAYTMIVLCDEIVMRELFDRPDVTIYSPAFPTTIEERHTILSNVQFMARARLLGLPIPDFDVCAGLKQGREAAARIGYPVMVKLAYGMAGSGVRSLESPDDWSSVNLPLDSPFLIQKYLMGKVGATNILFDHGRPLCWFSFLKRYNWPNRFGPSGGGVFVSPCRIDDTITRLGRAVEFTGLCSIDWIQEPYSENISVIEFNPRPTPSLQAGELAGVSMSDALRAMGRRDPVLPSAPIHPRRREFVMFPESTFHAVEYRKLTLFLRSLAAAPFDDPLLLLSGSTRLIAHYIHRALQAVFFAGRA